MNSEEAVDTQLAVGSPEGILRARYTGNEHYVQRCHPAFVNRVRELLCRAVPVH